MDKPWDDPSPVRVELATNPAADDPAWTDVSVAVKGSGVTVTRGRPGRWAKSQPMTAQTVVDNSDGQFSDIAGQPATLFGKRLRVSARDWNRAGNLITNGDFAPALGVTGWSGTAFGYGTAVIADSTTRSVRPHGHAMLVTWPTRTGSTAANWPVKPLVIGRKYEATFVVWVPTGSPNVKLQDLFATQGGTATAKDSWVVLRVRWTATTVTHYIGVTATNTTSGNQVWVGAARVDEGWTTRPLVEALRTNYATNPRQTTPDKVTVPGWSSGAEYIEPQFHTAFLGSAPSSSMSAGYDGGLPTDPVTDVLEGGHA